MARNFKDWLEAYIDYSQFTEAPARMHFWCGVSAIAGALQRNVWIDQRYFKWFPNMYIILVAPPGIVAKSTTLGISMELLKEVEGPMFGPDAVTMASLVEKFVEAKTEVAFPKPSGDIEYVPTCALTLESSELGNLIDPNDKAMVDLLVSLWDGKPGTFTKATKHSGTDIIENPWINLIGCTTPSWIEGNFPEYLIGGGFTSRTIFVYADKKAKYVPYPGLVITDGFEEKKKRLIEDLQEMTKLRGPFTMTPEAIQWGMDWYKRHYTSRPLNLDPDQFGGYLARKQTQMHKVAMILSVACGDSLIITDENLALADHMITELEVDLQFVFKRIGQSQGAQNMEKFLQYIHRNPQGVPYQTAYQHVHRFFPSLREFEDVVAGAIKAGFVKIVKEGDRSTVFPGSTRLPSSMEDPDARDPAGRPLV